MPDRLSKPRFFVNLDKNDKLTIRSASGISIFIFQPNLFLLRDTFADKRRLRNGTFYTISASGSNFGTLVKLQRYPRNIKYIPVVVRLRRIAFLELEQISADFENYHFSKVS